MAKATGSAARVQYQPGQKREPRFKEIPEGVYKFTLKDIGKPGLAGWRKGKGPKKFPNRMVRWQTVGCEDETTGKEMTTVDFVSASPGAAFRVEDLVYASQYPDALDAELPSTPQESAAVRAWCEQIDLILNHIIDNEIVLTGRVEQEEFKGRARAHIVAWLSEDDEAEDAANEEAEDEAAAFADEEGETDAADEATDEEVVEDVAEEPEPEAPKTSKAKAGKSKAK